MSIDQTILTLAQELMAEFDESIDTSEGSPFRSQVLDPLLTRCDLPSHHVNVTGWDSHGPVKAAKKDRLPEATGSLLLEYKAG